MRPTYFFLGEMRRHQIKWSKPCLSEASNCVFVRPHSDLLPEEKEQHRRVSQIWQCLASSPLLCRSSLKPHDNPARPHHQDAVSVSPSPGGEGRDEGGRSSNFP